MSKVENGLGTVVIYNPSSGNGFAESPEVTFKKNWPEVKVADIKDVNNYPEYNKIGLVGDGSHGSLAEKERAESEFTWYLPLEHGTINGIPRSLDLGKLAVGLEPDEIYFKRMITWLKEGKLKFANINPGRITTKETESSFMWLLLTGASARLLEKIEEARQKGLNKTTRVLYGGIEYYRYILSERKIDINSQGQDKTVWDVMVLNRFFNQIGIFNVGTRNGLIWTITRPENKSEKERKIKLILLDLFSLSMGVKHSGKGLETRIPNPGETITIYDSQQPYKIDSEKCNIRGQVTVSLPENLENPYRILVPNWI
jgi:hypothetical protein